MQLNRSVLACLLWERQFYEEGVEIAGRIADLVPKWRPRGGWARHRSSRADETALCAASARPRDGAPQDAPGSSLGELQQVIQRADELAEFVAIYWKDGCAQLSGQVKKGLAAALTSASPRSTTEAADQTAGRADVLFLCHAKPRDDAQAAIWKRLILGRLTTPDTWEVALSSGRTSVRLGSACFTGRDWERSRCSAICVILEAGVDESLVLSALGSISAARVLPFRFLAAARAVPQWEEMLEQAMLKSVAASVAASEKLPGRTIALVDVSGSMTAPLSRRSEMQQTDTAYGLAVLLREIGERVAVFSFSKDLVEVPARRDSRCKLQKRCRLRQVDIHRWLVRVGYRVRPSS